MKHFKKVLFNIFGQMILNAYVLYKINTNKPLSRLHFQMSIVEALAEEWLEFRNRADDIGGGGDGPTQTMKYFDVEKLEGAKEKNCSVCSGVNDPEGRRRLSKNICVKCKLGCHLDCLPNY